MIRIHRGREPAALRPVRIQRLGVARPLVAAGALERKHIDGYEVIKSALWSRQHYKCCYCERNNLESRWNPIEHFRPAMRARHGYGFSAHGGYWWLAWTWSNLLFACSNCNSGAKLDQFPLEPGSISLLPEEAPPGSEKPLLVDPCLENPITHIQFKPVAMANTTRWMPFPRNGSRKGVESIRVLQLNRPELLDLYGRHVDRNIDPVITRLGREMGVQSNHRVHEIWNDEVLTLVEPAAPFTALSFDAVDHYVPIGVRRRWSLSLRQPG